MPSPTSDLSCIFQVIAGLWHVQACLVVLRCEDHKKKICDNHCSGLGLSQDARMLAISQDAEGLSILWDRMLGAPRGLRGFAKTHVFQQAVIPSGGSINRMSAMVVSNGCQQWLSAMAVSNDCQQWLSAMAVSNGCQQWLSAMAVLVAVCFPAKNGLF